MKELIRTYTEKYLNKNEIGFRLPGTIDLEEFWSHLQEARKKDAESIPLKDQKQNDFWFNITHLLQKRLHEIDADGRDSLFSAVKSEIAHEMIKESLIEEALSSSVIEGAFSTLKRARELAEGTKQPKDNSEQMVLNNFKAMRFIVENLGQDFSRELILELHRIVTENCLDDNAYAGKFRDDWVYVVDQNGQAIYTPPPADQIEPLINELVEWTNLDSEESFIHPIIKASIIHFYMVYLHPFFDGNGRTARALFYFYLLKKRYDFFKYFSISAIICKNRSSYYKAIKDVEDYGSDLTYFLLFMADTVLKAILEIRTKISEQYNREFFLDKIQALRIALNPRQDKFIKRFLLWSKKEVSIEKYEDLFKVVYQTARSDLLDLAKKHILRKTRSGKKFIFSLNYDLLNKP
ncbi:MAG: Fic family protein [Candidatus Margulisiibacteriota bacterium]